MSDEQLMSHILRTLETLNNNVNALSKEMGELRSLVETMPKCPAPGSCSQLQESVDRIEEETDAALSAIRADVDEHKLLVAKLSGGWKMLTIICAVCSTLGGAAGWLIGQFSK